ncbi:DUF3429 domain-containing protein [Sphingomonas corticis]|jgi:hypothetical protein|uniref:DUF3429 domain-containing protein n=1 Tax=Sphingomonas corticis TaxID=2722791 RepID=A0ABX1CMQ5_9SPHN|nr:DUF3429 domain-containing protein [Sphingomonas corticis]NJR79219.1 DUF3429 domain-containing protein [Sphingomonas corticis]
MIPRNAQVLGFGPMLPLVAAGIGAWVLPGTWPILAVQLAIVWGAIILAFIGGVRRGFGFARESASTAVAIAAATAYLTIAGLALVVPRATMALALLIVGYALAALLDRRAALAGNAPAFFAPLRPPQLLLGAAGMAGCWAWLMG